MEDALPAELADDDSDTRAADVPAVATIEATVDVAPISLLPQRSPFHPKTVGQKPRRLVIDRTHSRSSASDHRPRCVQHGVQPRIRSAS
jgi:hypothetical protein